MPKITPGQGLLLLIEYYQDDREKQTQLKKLYLSGASDADRCIALCDALLNEPLLADYDIAIDEASIDADPSRRYFETHLAYQTLNYQLNDIDREALNALLQSSSALVAPEMSHDTRRTITSVLNGQCHRPNFKKRQNYQYSGYIRRLKSESIFPEFNQIAREKIVLLVKIQYMALVNGWRSTDMPIDIYQSEQFGNAARGKIHRGDELRSARNRSFGLLKGHMPLAADDLALSDQEFDHMKSVDYSTYDIDSPVVQACFQQLVHPFSNSISGCFLVQLRTLACLHSLNKSHGFTRSVSALTQILRLSIASALFYSGGHSLYEYAAILALPEVQDFFAYMPEFANFNLEHLFYDGNESAFDAALASTLQYNRSLLKRNAVRNELLFFRSSSPYSSDFSARTDVENSEYSGYSICL